MPNENESANWTLAIIASVAVHAAVLGGIWWFGGGDAASGGTGETGKIEEAGETGGAGVAGETGETGETEATGGTGETGGAEASGGGGASTGACASEAVSPADLLLDGGGSRPAAERRQTAPRPTPRQGQSAVGSGGASTPRQAGGGKTPVPQVPEFYEVKQGDTITKIAKMFATTPEELARINGKPLKKLNLIWVGQKIRIREK